MRIWLFLGFLFASNFWEKRIFVEKSFICLHPMSERSFKFVLCFQFKCKIVGVPRRIIRIKKHIQRPARTANKFVENWCENYHLSDSHSHQHFIAKSLPNLNAWEGRTTRSRRRRREKKKKLKSTLRKTNNLTFEGKLVPSIINPTE